MFSGTDDTKVTLRTASEAGAIESTIVTLPDGKTTADYILYELDVGPKLCALTIDRSSSPLATHYVHLPRAYRPLDICAYVQNTGTTGSATSLLIEALCWQNVDELNVQRIGSGAPIPVIVLQPAGERGDITFGSVSLSAANTTAVMRATTYIEQSASFTGSIVSANAADAAAGTGLRTVVITYYDENYSGPFIETVTLNGTTPVSLSASKKYIESIRGVTAGSSGAAVGVITLRNDAAATVGTIAAGARQTDWLHHYVPKGKTCRIMSISHGNSSTATNAGSRMHLRATKLDAANAITREVTGFLAGGGAASQANRIFEAAAAPMVIGPARVEGWVTTSSATTITYFGDFSYLERG